MDHTHQELVQLHRTPIPSPPAKDPISKIQIALNNLISQLCESVFVVIEEAPQSNFGPDETSEDDQVQARKLNEQIIPSRAGNCAAIIAAIRGLSDELPSSLLDASVYENTIQAILRETEWVTAQLERQNELVSNLEEALSDQIRSLMEQVAVTEY